MAAAPGPGMEQTKAVEEQDKPLSERLEATSFGGVIEVSPNRPVQPLAHVETAWTSSPGTLRRKRLWWRSRGTSLFEALRVTDPRPRLMCLYV